MLSILLWLRINFLVFTIFEFLLLRLELGIQIYLIKRAKSLVTIRSKFILPRIVISFCIKVLIVILSFLCQIKAHLIHALLAFDYRSPTLSVTLPLFLNHHGLMTHVYLEWLQGLWVDAKQIRIL